MTEKELAIINNESPQAMFMAAIDKGMDLDKLEKFMELQTKYEQNQARKAFFLALADFKAEQITVLKDKTNSQYKSKYASEDSILNTVNPILSKHGLSASFTYDQSNGLTVTCILTHSGGHRESVSLTGQIDGSGQKNPLQQLKSTDTYLRKATFAAITGIAASDGDSDDDGNGAAACISDKQVSTITDMINAKTVDPVPFLAYMGVAEITQIKESDFEKAMKALRLAKGKAK